MIEGGVDRVRRRWVALTEGGADDRRLLLVCVLVSLSGQRTVL
jgi:hypothetical protein